MKSRAPLAMMEALVMLAVFALAAALCLQAFVKADELSRRSEARDHAALLCQTVAEEMKNAGGTPEEALRAVGNKLGSRSAEDAAFTLGYDGDWAPAGEDGTTYRLTVSAWESDVPGLARGEVCVEDLEQETARDGELFRLQFAWQEVTADGT